MKKAILVLSLFGCAGYFAACEKSDTAPSADTNAQDQIDELKEKIAALNPEMGDIMLNIQLRHSKLYFAGKNAYWDLANFELHEMDESFDQIRVFKAGNPALETLKMIEPAMDSLAADILRKDTTAFSRNFDLLTNGCNSCHGANQVNFVNITVPTVPAVTNQNFTDPFAQH